MSRGRRAAGVLAGSLVAAVLLMGALWRFAPGFMGWFGLWRAFSAVGLEREVVAVDGRSVGIAHGGDGKAMVMLHGHATDKRAFLAYAPQWRERWSILLVDLPLHGDSGPASAEGRSASVADLAALLDERAIQRVTLIGQGLGAELALAHALEHPDQVEKLVLLAPTGLAPLGVEEDRLYPDDETGVDALVQLLYGELEIPPGLRRQLIAERLELGTREQAWTITVHAEPPLDPSALKVPTLAVFGTADALVPSEAERALDTLDHVELHRLDGCPHVVSGDCLQQTLRLMHAFIDPD